MSSGASTGGGPARTRRRLRAPAPPAAVQAAPPAPPAAPAAGPGSDDMARRVELLRQLGELRAQGVLSEEEFAEQKTRVLA